MKILVLFIALLALIPAAFAQEQGNYSIAAYYSFETKDWSGVATTRFDTLWTDPFGIKGATVELHGIVGGNAQTGLGGGALFAFYPIHPRINVGAGLALVKRSATLDGFFDNFKGFELGVSLSINYTMRF